MKSKKAYRSWAYSYFIIICVAFLCSACFYFVIGSVVKQEVNRSNTAILENLKLSMDAQIGDMQKIASDIGSNKVFERLYIAGEPEGDFSYRAKKAQEELKRYQSINTNLEEIYLYLPENDYVVSSQRVVPAELMYEISYSGTGVSIDEWKKMLLESKSNTILPFCSVNEAEEVEDSMVLLRTLPAGSKNPQMVLLVSVSSQKLSMTMDSGAFPQNSYLFLLNAKNKVVLSNTDQALPVTYEELQQEAHRKYKVNGKNYMITSSQSDVMNMRYVLGIPNAAYNKTGIFVRNTAFVGMFLFLAVALYAAFKLLKKNYTPLKELMGYVDAAGEYAEEENEYHLFKKAITNAVNDKVQMQDKLRRQSETMKDHLLLQLLKGKTNGELQMDDMMVSYDVDFKGNHYMVLVFFVEYFDELFEGSTKEMEEQMSLAFLVVRNITKELLDKSFENIFVEVDDMMVCLINTQNGDYAALRTRIGEILEQARRLIKENFYIDFTVAVSGLEESQRGIAVAYQEAMEAMDYKLVMGSGGTIFFDETQSSEENYHYPIETELKLMNAVKAGDADGARDILRELLEQNFEQRSLSAQMAKCLISNLTSTLIKVMDEAGVQNHTDFTAETELAGHILAGNDIHEIRQELFDLTEALSRKIDDNKDSSTHKIVQQVKDYLSKNYEDFNLSLHSIADEFHITHTYLSRIFKQETGEGLLQYLNKLRTEEVKKLLRESDLSIVEIAERTGFGNSNSLIRTFKKYNGITPGKYREL